MQFDLNLWYRTMYSRAWVRVKSTYGEPLWVAVNLAVPLLSSSAMALLYESTGLGKYSWFAILGGIMLAFWGNVLWAMASQFNWDKEVGIFEIYLVSPAPISAILVGMSLGGILATAPSAAFVSFVGWAFFSMSISPSWLAVFLTFILTLASLYAMGMLLSSLYLAYGREAESLNNAIGEPINFLSGIYFPSIGTGSPFPFALQVAASFIPLTIGMDALRKSVFYADGIHAIWLNLVILAAMAIILLILGDRALKSLEERGRREGTLVVRLR
jgi:ABC-2 type transport system permease protein